MNKISTESRKTVSCKSDINDMECLRIALDNMAVAAYCVGPHGEIVFANKAAHELFGYPAGELFGREITTLMPERFRETYTNLVNRLFREDHSRKQRKPIEALGLRKDGTEFPAELSLTTSAIESSAILTWLVKDATETRQAERRLKKSEKAYRTLTEAIPSALLLIDLNSNIAVCNHRGVALFAAKNLAAVVGKNLVEMVAPQDRQRLELDIKETMDTGSVSYNEYTLVYQDGASFPAELSLSAVYNSKKEPKGAAVNISSTVGRKKVAEQLRVRVRGLEEIQAQTVDAVSKMISMKDPYVADHQERVTRLACAIAAELGLAQERIGELRLAGIFHDVGKLFVPSYILSKPGKLTDQEFQAIKNHARASYDTINAIGFPAPVVEAVIQHHERLNGSGYPDGLSGNEITLEARIMVVADVVEAMSTRRPYRAGLGEGKALEEISENSGRLFDPEVAEACKELFTIKRFTFHKINNHT